jgi:hypothetical protein
MKAILSRLSGNGLTIAIALKRELDDLSIFCGLFIPFDDVHRV